MEFIVINSTSIMAKAPLPGLGWLVLRDLFVTNLVLDGVDIGNPKEKEHPLLWQNFRGFFNVPSGKHSITGLLKFDQPGIEDLSASCEVNVSPGKAAVKVFTAKPASWSDDAPDSELRYRNLAESNTMYGCLRGWHQAMLFFHKVKGDVQLDGKKIMMNSDFQGVVGIDPGKHSIQIKGQTLAVECPEESIQVIDGSGGALNVLPGEQAMELFNDSYSVLNMNSYLRLK